MIDLRELTGRHLATGRIEAIVLRPRRGEPARAVDWTRALAGRGLEGDRRALRRRAARPRHKREVTLIQAEHLPLMARWLGARDDRPGCCAATWSSPA